MLEIGVQSEKVVYDENPLEGFSMLKEAGFSCCDFSLNYYLTNTSLYQSEVNEFFDRTEGELEDFFARHGEAAKTAGIRINQMHMPYPCYVPKGTKELNDYLLRVVAPKSMRICSFLECSYIVVHGFKLAEYLGSEEAEWEKTEGFLDTMMPMAKEYGITVCIENLYSGVGRHIVEGPCCNARKAAMRIDKMNEKYGAEVLGFCFDTGHANLVGIDFEDFITTLGSRLKVLHIHDNDGNSDLHQIPFTFSKSRENTSSTDWDGFERGIRKIGFDGVLSFETAPVLNAFPAELKSEALGLIARIGAFWADRLS